MRGQTRLRRMASRWLVAPVDESVWVRVTGLVAEEWDCLAGRKKEEKTLQRLRASLRPGMTFVDVGANIGYFTLLAGSVVGPAGRVVAFEPTPAVVNRLRENVRLNGLRNVTSVQKAISDHRGTAQFFLSDEDPEANSLFRQNTAAKRVEVETATLDDELSRYAIGKVDVLKIDTEGAELSVLQGARKTLTGASPPKIFLEINPVTLRMAGVAAEQIFNKLDEFGYGWQVLEQFSWQGTTVFNIFATGAK
jgi:FkbM family methyltransferase